MAITNNWIVLAGGPNSGKTTTVNALKDLGYTVEAEQATKIIHEYIDKGVALDTLHTDRIAGAEFQEQIAVRQIEAEDSHNQSELVFFDRGAFDYLVFSMQRGLPINKEVEKAVKSRKYRQVFLLSLIESEFLETKIEAHLANPRRIAKQQEQIMIKTLEELKIPYTRIPVMSVEDRVKSILAKLESIN